MTAAPPIIDVTIIRAKLATAGDTVTLSREEADALREAAAAWLDPDAPVEPDGLADVKVRAGEFGERWAAVLDGSDVRDGARFALEFGALYAALIAAEREACRKTCLRVATGFGVSRNGEGPGARVARLCAEHIQKRSLR